MRILLIREANEAWAAQWLEHDLVGQGRTREEALASLEQAIHAAVEVAEAKGEIPLAHFRPAPWELWRLWEQRQASDNAAPLRAFALPAAALQPQIVIAPQTD